MRRLYGSIILTDKKVLKYAISVAVDLKKVHHIKQRRDRHTINKNHNMKPTQAFTFEEQPFFHLFFSEISSSY